MDIKSAFLYGKIKKEVYVCQPQGFEDLDFLDRVYKVEKVLYGLHQAPRAWYETLSTYLLDNRFQRGKIDKTLFIRRDKGDILLVQVYVDDIIFGSTKKSLCNEFENLMHKKFQMSFIEVKTASTPIETQKHLLKDEDGEEVDVHLCCCIVMVEIDPYFVKASLDYVYSNGRYHGIMLIAATSLFGVVDHEVAFTAMEGRITFVNDLLMLRCIFLCLLRVVKLANISTGNHDIVFDAIVGRGGAVRVLY
ncbi:putative ribonuclease H-like domain-containing protein [Tanacetum coccineum]